VDGVNVRQFKITGNLEVGIRGEVDAYRDFVRQARPDVMMNYNSHAWPTDLIRDLLPRLPFAKVLNPVCFSLRDVYPDDYNQALPSMLSNYDAIVYMSEQGRDLLLGRELGFRDKEVVIPNGADEAEFLELDSSFRERFGIRTPMMVLTVSNHYRAKGHVPLIRAFRALDRDDTTLVIVGERPGPLWRGCHVYCQLAGLRRDILSLHGRDRQMVVDAYKAADLFALASRIECSPLVIFETMAAGVPFVALEAGDVGDKRAFGSVVPTLDDLAPAMAAMLNDPEGRKEKGAAARRAWQERFTWETITDQMETLYEQVSR
jgi:glycosyltransferase involved in cell wall biosynthesis